MEAASGGIDMRGDGIGRENMAGERVQLRRIVAEEKGEGDGREGVRVGVVGRARENHDYRDTMC